MMSSERSAVAVSLPIAAVVAMGVLGCLIYLLVEGEFDHLRVENTKVLPLTLPVKNLSEIWFSPAGDLLATFQKNTVLFLASWELERGGRAGMKTLDFARRGAQPAVLMNSFHGGPLDNHAVVSVVDLAYAISNAGSTIAWVWKGQLFVGPVDNFQNIKSLPLTQTVQATAISFTGSDLITTVHPNTGVSNWSIANAAKVSDVSCGIVPALIWARGQFRVISSVADYADLTNSCRLQITKERVEARRFPVVREGCCFAASDSGSVLMGTSAGMVIVSESIGFNPVIVIRGMQGVKALAFYDEKSAVAAGDGPGLVLIKGGTLATELAPTPGPVRLLAVNRNHVAYATAQSLLLSDLRWELGLSERARAYLAIMFSLIGFLAFVRVILIDIVRLRGS